MTEAKQTPQRRSCYSERGELPGLCFALAALLGERIGLVLCAERIQTLTNFPKCILYSFWLALPLLCFGVSV